MWWHRDCADTQNDILSGLGLAVNAVWGKLRYRKQALFF